MFDNLENILISNGIMTSQMFTGVPEPGTNFLSGIGEWLKNNVKLPEVNVNIQNANLGGVGIPVKDLSKYVPYIVLGVLGLAVYFIWRK